MPSWPPPSRRVRWQVATADAAAGRPVRLLLAALLLGAVSLSGCATQQVRMAQSGSEAISFLASLPADARPRVVIAPVRDNTRTGQFSALEAGLALGQHQATGTQFLGGVQDLLTTGLLNTGAFTVLERSDLDELSQERIMRAEQGEQVTLENALEGADFVVTAALTSFEPSGGGSIPIPIPFGDDHFGIVWIKRGTSSLAMDLRVLDVETGRVVHSNAVRGSARRFGIDVDAFISIGRSYLSLPGALSYYNKTPMHAAILQMVELTVGEVADAARPSAAPLQSAVAD